jgi:4-hydroxybenzoate polyprenyltransferase
MQRAVPTSQRPLCVDMDGTLIRTDSLWESVLLLVKSRPWSALLLVYWVFGGRAHLKRKIAARVQVDPAHLPFNPEFLEWLKSERVAGRWLVLATAADESVAQTIAAHFGFFDEVIASNGSDNLKGFKKLARLRERFGDDFDYAGNSRADVPIWNQARLAIAVETPAIVTSRLERDGRLLRSFDRKVTYWKLWRRALRVHQWSKNILVFLPALTSHRILERPVIVRSSLMFLAFSCCASALYIVNDLLDLGSDREHSRKRLRPFASGDLPIVAGVAAVPVLLLVSFSVAGYLGRLSLLIVIAYACVSASYSLWLKRRAPLDVFLLSGLYTFRILAGGVANGIWLSGWLLSFSGFLFLSLAFNKRASELYRNQEQPDARIRGRGYLASDLPQVNTCGVVSGFISSLVLSFYISSEQVRTLYLQPVYLWLLFPVLLYWLTELWLLSWRGEVDEDPVVFALKSPSTYWLGLVAIILVLIAKFDPFSSFLR